MDWLIQPIQGFEMLEEPSEASADSCTGGGNLNSCTCTGGLLSCTCSGGLVKGS